MQHLKYTYVDARTGVPCTEAAMPTGPAVPNVPGLQFGFALESLYPTATPVFYGTAPAAELSTPGVLELVSEAEYDAARDQEVADRAAKEAAQEEAALLALRADMIVSRFQARAALMAAGLLATIEGAVAAYDGPDAAFVQLAWSEAMEWKRLSPTVAAIASIVGLTDEQLDDLFIAAAQIEA